MGIALILLLPLIGGYFFSSNWKITRYSTALEDGHRLYFRSIFTAIILFTFAFAIHWLLLTYIKSYDHFEKNAYNDYFKFLFWGQAQRDKYQIFVISVYALALGISSWFPLNRLVDRYWDWYKRRSNSGSHIELLKLPPFLLATVRNDDMRKMLLIATSSAKSILLSLENNKIYVGLITDYDPIARNECLTISPLMSGYRDPTTQEAIFTTYYSKVYRVILEPSTELSHLTLDDFKVVIPLSRISTLSLFDLEAYNYFQEQNSQAQIPTE